MNWCTNRDGRTRANKGRLPRTARTHSYRHRLRLQALEARHLLATFSVSNLEDSGAGSLRQAILDANEQQGPDDIVFESRLQGTITLTSGQMEITEAVNVNGPGAAMLTIDADRQSRIFAIDDGDDGDQAVLLRGLTLTGGYVSYGDGGAILSGENLTLDEITITGNEARSVEFGGLGGGIFVGAGQLTITDSTISSNTARFGGGIYTASGSETTIVDSTVSDNRAIFSGGGIDARGSLTITNSTISGNSAGGSGGGARLFGDTQVRYSTVTQNVANDYAPSYSEGFSDGGGFHVSYSGRLRLYGSLVAENRRSRFDLPDEADDISGDVSDASSYNLVGVDTRLRGISDGSHGNQIGTAKAPLDPLLGPLADNGGPTLTHALLSGSLAIDAGDPAAAAGMAGVPQFDQRGTPFPRVSDGLGEDGPRIDIGAYELFRPVSISGYKWDDTDGDGVWDAGEPGIQGWAIEFDSNGDGEADETVTTDSNGFYQFSDLGPGNYEITEQPQDGWTNTYDGSTTVVATSGVVAAGEFQVAESLNFGNFRNISISGYKWFDINVNGIWDAGEQGLEDWVIELDSNGDGEADETVTTDSNGFYQFSDLGPGTYGITEQPQDGWTNTYNGSTTVVATSGMDASGAFEMTQVLNFGNTQNFSISGYKWEDTNGDGNWDAGEPGLPNWVIELDANENGEADATATTDANGFYQFSNLGPGTYGITEQPQDGWTNTYDGSTTVVAMSGMDAAGTFEVAEHLNFGNFRNISISGYKWEDTNGDDNWDAGEPGLPNWVIELDANEDGEADEAVTTDANGFYQFFDLGPGTYGITEQPQDGWTNTYDGSTTVVAMSGMDAAGTFEVAEHLNFGNFRNISISGYKWEDTDGDGNWDAGEPGLPNWVIELDANEDGEADEAVTTDANGFYQFSDLGPGTYGITEQPQDGWTNTYNGSSTVFAKSGMDAAGTFEVAEHLNFGNFRNISISGYKWEDTNGDGNWDAGESGLPNWVIELDANEDGEADEAVTTDANGFYQFSDLGPGTYGITEQPQDGWTNTYNGSSTVFAKSGMDAAGTFEVAEHLNFGNFRNISISGYKWEDTNGDGNWGAGEPGLPNWVIELDANEDGEADEAVTTDANGFYQFSDLGPGTYGITEQPQDGWTNTYDGSTTVVAMSGMDAAGTFEVAEYLNWGNFRDVDIRGTKYEDMDGFGASPSDDVPYFGSTQIELFADRNGNGEFEPNGADSPPIATTTTSEVDGSYTFAQAGPGVYFVREDPTFLIEQGLVQTDGGDDFSMGVDYYTLATRSGGQLTDNDFWNFELVTIAGKKFDDRNGNGVQDDGEFGLAGWTIQLDLNDDGTIDRTVRTDDEGRYVFTNVGAGTHRVREQDEPNWAPTLPGAVAIPTGISAGYVISAELDGRHQEDLVVANDYASTVGAFSTLSILLSNGQGGYDPPIDVALSPQVRPKAIFAAQLVGDDRIDLAVATVGDGTNQTPDTNAVIILENLGGGVFRIHGVYPTCPTNDTGVCDLSGGGRQPLSLSGGDFDNDGRVDLVTANYVTNDLSILRNTGNGQFVLTDIIPVGMSPIAIQVGALTTDSQPPKLDLVVASFEAGEVSVVRGNGDGTFVRGVTLDQIDNPYALLLRDFDGDHQLDVAVSDWSDDEVVVLPGQGDGTFGAGLSLAVESNPASLAAGDLLGGAPFDLLVANAAAGSISILENMSTPGRLSFQPAVQKLPPSPNTAAGVNPLSIAVGDYDGLGRWDVVTAHAIGGVGIVYSDQASYAVTSVSGTPFTSLDFGTQYNKRTSLRQVDLAVTVDPSAASLAPEDEVTFSFVVSNSGPQDVVGADIRVNLPASLENVVYSSISRGNVLGNTASGQGNIADLVTMQSGSAIEYIITGTVGSAASGTLTVQSTVGAPADRVDTYAGNNAADFEVFIVRAAFSAMDMNHDGQVSPLDALLVINYLTLVTQSMGSPPEPDLGLDVNGDGIVAPLDALLIINELNQVSSAVVYEAVGVGASSSDSLLGIGAAIANSVSLARPASARPDPDPLPGRATERWMEVRGLSGGNVWPLTLPQMASGAEGEGDKPRRSTVIAAPEPGRAGAWSDMVLRPANAWFQLADAFHADLWQDLE